MWEHFSNVLSKNCVINHTWQSRGWRRRGEVWFPFREAQRSEPALLSIWFSVPIFPSTPFSFFPCQTCRDFFFPLFQLLSYMKCILQVSVKFPTKYPWCTKSRGLLKKFLVSYYSGNTDQCFLVFKSYPLSFIVRKVLGQQEGWQIERKYYCIGQTLAHSQWGQVRGSWMELQWGLGLGWSGMD